jgi:hypothetical protein
VVEKRKMASGIRVDGGMCAERERGCWVFVCFGYGLAERGKGMRDE